MQKNQLINECKETKKELEVEYVTIDFETANGNLTSACSVGLVGCKNGKILFEKYYLINPQEEFLPQNVAIHGITKDMVIHERTFDQIYDEIYELINGNVLFAHAATFDISVLKSLIKKYNLKTPNIKIGCTLKVSQIAFKDTLTSFKLGNISSYLGVEHNKHNAISDASICFYLLERVKRMYQVYDVYDLFEELGLCFGTYNDNEFKGCYSRFSKKVLSEVKSDKLKGVIYAFTGKPKKTTKTEFKKMMAKNGAIFSRDITRVINTFIIFENPVKSHIHAVNHLQELKKIKVYTEEEVMDLLHD